MQHSASQYTIQVCVLCEASGVRSPYITTPEKKKCYIYIYIGNKKKPLHNGPSKKGMRERNHPSTAVIKQPIGQRGVKNVKKNQCVVQGAKIDFRSIKDCYIMHAITEEPSVITFNSVLSVILRTRNKKSRKNKPQTVLKSLLKSSSSLC